MNLCSFSHLHPHACGEACEHCLGATAADHNPATCLFCLGDGAFFYRLTERVVFLDSVRQLKGGTA